MSMHYAKGNLLYRQRRYQEAELEFKQALAEDPHDVISHAMLAATMASLKQFDKSRKEIGQALKLAPDMAFCHYILATIESAAGRNGDAKKAIKEAIRLDPEDPVYYAFASAVAIDENKWSEALKFAEEGLRNDPEHVDCINSRAQALVRLGRQQEAEDSIDLALKLDPEDSWTHSNKGWLLVRRGRIDEAITYFKEALRLNPNSDWAYRGVIEALKARNPIYHLCLMSSLSISEMSQSLQRTLYWVCWVIPPLRALLIMILLANFLTNTLFTFMLRLDPYGRRVLTDATKKQNNYSLIGAALVVGFFVWVCTAGDLSGVSNAARDGSKYYNRGKYEEANAAWLDAIAKAKSEIRDNHPSRVKDGLEELKRRLAKAPKASPDTVAQASITLGECYLAEGDEALAEQSFREGLSKAKQVSDHRLYIHSLIEIGKLQEKQGHPKLADDEYREAFNEIQRFKYKEDPEFASFYSSHVKSSAKGSKKSSPSVSDSPSDTVTAELMRVLQRKIKRNWFPPRISSSASVTTSFVLLHDGNVKKVKVDVPSSVSEMDAACVKAIKDAAPFDPLPKSLGKEVQIQFTFDYNARSNSPAKSN